MYVLKYPYMNIVTRWHLYSNTYVFALSSTQLHIMLLLLLFFIEKRQCIICKWLEGQDLFLVENEGEG